MMRSRKMRLVAAGLLVLAVGGCAGRVPELNLGAEVGWKQVCAALQSRWAKLESLEAQARYVAETPWGNLSGFGRVALDFAAGAMAVELRGPLGVRALVLQSVGDTLWAYVPMENAVFCGSFGRGLPEEGWRQVLMRAAVGQLAPGCDVEAQVEPYGPDRLRVEARAGDRALRALLDRRWGDVLHVTLTSGGSRLALEYSGYRGLKGMRLPGLVKLQSEEPRLRLALSYEELTVNRPIRWSRYTVRIPASARRVSLARLLALGEPGGGDLTFGGDGALP